jgi:hypothetical protein
MNSQEQVGLQKLSKLLESLESPLIEELHRVNDFIKRCQALEKAMPGVKFYY